MKDAQNRKWQLRWNIEPRTNKLKNIKDTVKRWTTSAKMDRKTEVMLARLRIGHTLITHGHLMTLPREEPPKCNKCDVQLTVCHMIQDCPHVNRQRIQTIGRNPISEVLGSNVKIASLTKYLKSIQIYDLI